MALIEFNKMIADESEPSLWTDSLDSSSSISSEDSEINNLLQRQTSISLFNVSTPMESCQERRNRYRSAIVYNTHSDRKKRKYKQYSHDNQNDKAKEEPILKLEYLETKMKQDNNINVSPDISAKYIQALKEIETLQTQINKMKSERFSTPLFVRRKSLQSSMIKTCLFKNTSTALRPSQLNSTKSSLFGADSTCMTIDIEDKSPQTENEVFHDFVMTNNKSKGNPFLIKAESPISLNNTNCSEDPLISNSRKANKPSKMRDFVFKFLKCPGFLHNAHDTRFRNKISPIPKVVIISPHTPETDSGNDSDVQQIRLADFNCNTPQMNKIMKDMSKCAEELSQKLHIFRNVLEQCKNQNNYK